MASRRCSVLLATFAIAVASTSISAARIHPNLHRQLQRTRDAVDIVIEFKEKHTRRALEALNDDPTLDPSEQISNMIQHLDRASKETQHEVLNVVLTQESDDVEVGEVTSLWITSSLFVNGASYGFIQQVSQLDSVSEVRLPVEIPVNEPESTKSEPAGITHTDEYSAPFPEWGVEKIQAPQVWEAGFTGQNVTVAIIDTGVRGTHEALGDSFVGLSQNGWYDPMSNTSEPHDQTGHGTHCLGSILGQKGLGVAPGAKWMACNAHRDGIFPELGLLLCSQWVVCPHDSQGKNHDCNKRPHIVSNSWNIEEGMSYFSDIIDIWHLAGIVPVFAMGNTGPNCSTARPPASYTNVISVGATLQNDRIASFSSRGPGINGTVKPDISAPGDFIYSALNGSDTSYGFASGTSMATPHVAGVIALMLSANHSLTFEDIKRNLFTGAITKTLVNTNSNCGGIREDVFPNNVYGHGRVDAYQAIFGRTPEPTTLVPVQTTPPGPARTDGTTVGRVLESSITKSAICTNYKSRWLWCAGSFLCSGVNQNCKTNG